MRSSETCRVRIFGVLRVIRGCHCVRSTLYEHPSRSRHKLPPPTGSIIPAKTECMNPARIPAPGLGPSRSPRPPSAKTPLGTGAASSTTQHMAPAWRSKAPPSRTTSRSRMGAASTPTSISAGTSLPSTRRSAATSPTAAAAPSTSRATARTASSSCRAVPSPTTRPTSTRTTRAAAGASSEGDPGASSCATR